MNRQDDRLEQAKAYILRYPLAISGQGGHNTTYKLACQLIHGFDLPEEDAMGLIRQYNQRLNDPWEEWELRHKVDDALRAPETKPAGYLLAATRRKFITEAAPSLRRDILIIKPVPVVIAIESGGRQVSVAKKADEPSLPVALTREAYVVLWSASQQRFRVETVGQMLQRNTAASYGVGVTDLIPVAFFATEDEANRYEERATECGRKYAGKGRY